jgi:YD repeat-containing protein
VSIPNGMTTAYSYDTRNRLTKIDHKDGATVKDGWTYAYDARYRLTAADRYESLCTVLVTDHEA